MRALLASLACLIPVAVQAEGEPAPSPQPSPQGERENRAAITLESGKSALITCDTKAVVVAEGAPAATKGLLKLRLELAGSEPVPQGRWSIASVGDAHTGSLAFTQRKTCEAGCPLTLPAGGDIQLWAPKPSSIDQIGDRDVLLLAIIKPATGVLRASTFRGKAIEALEEGKCVSHEDHAPGAVSGPAAPDK